MADSSASNGNGQSSRSQQALTRVEQGRRGKYAGKLAAASRSRRARQQKQTSDSDELVDLQQRCDALLKQVKSTGQDAEAAPAASLTRFDQLPLTRKTLAGLKKSSFVEMTDIQAKSLPLSLGGRDILGAARTGSGKTLAFVIPVLERLYRERWGPSDGLGALIISPTRELAIQIFEVLRKVGISHTLSAGLVIGGKDVKSEKDRLARMNILVATPGRLLQHMDQTAGFDTGNVQVLVLDEADRCLDMGFANTLDAILENIPKNGRQTLLFSATQTKRVRDLARLSLSSPEYVAVHDEESKKGYMPANLQQHYMVVPLPNKLSTLFSFIRTHLKSKILVFFSACRQVQFAHETMRRMRPGMSLLCLHGKQKQTKRFDIFNNFTKTQHAVLFATDIAARGLDFPRVDWVIQVDAPEDAETYIHRVGRTARYNAKGNSLLFLLPSEEQGMVASLKKKGIEPDSIKAKENKLHDISNQLQSFLFQEPELKYLGQKAFVSYVRSIYLQRDKVTFDVTELPLDAYAESLGLAGAPKVKFVKDAQAAKKKAARLLEKEQYKQAALAKRAAEEQENGTKQQPDDGRQKSKYDRMFERKNQGVLSEHYRGLIAEDDDEDDADEGKEIGSESDKELGESACDENSEDERDSDDEEEVTREQAIAGKVKESDRGRKFDDDVDDTDDFITLKRADHGLDENEGSVGNGNDDDRETHLSKRKLQLGASKKRAAAAGLRGIGEKLTFDEDGQAHKLYEVQGEETLGDARKATQEFVERERQALRERDVEDKERVRQLKRDKKLRKRERELEERQGGGSRVDGSDDEEGGGGGVMFVAPSDDERDDGYETPEFELPEDRLEEEYRPQKRQKHTGNLQDDEEMALRLLGV